MNFEQQKKDDATQQLREYKTPRVVVYGDVRHLTSSGPASGKEGKGMGNEDRKA